MTRAITQTTIERAVRAAQKTGHKVTRVDVTADCVRVYTDASGADVDVPALDRWMTERRRAG